VTGERCKRRLEGGVPAVAARRRPSLAHDLFGEKLAALDAGGLGVRSEHAQAALAEQIGQAGDERRLRSDHGQVGTLLGGEVEQRRDVVGADGHAVRLGGDAGVARGAEHLRSEAGLHERMDEGVLSAAAADHEHPHAASSFPKPFARRVRADARESSMGGPITMGPPIAPSRPARDGMSLSTRRRRVNAVRGQDSMR